MRVLVTGSTGFVGRRVVEILARRGHAVRRALRSPAASPKVEDVVIGDLSSPAGLDLALADVDAVVHLAARVHVMDGEGPVAAAKFMKVNAEGTRQLAEAAKEAGVEHFVFVSTVKVNGEIAGSDAPFTESDPPGPEDPYARSKLAGERVVWEVFGERSTILRPPLVYGPGVGANFMKLMEAIYRGTPIPLARVDNRRSMIYVDNLAALVVQAAERRPQGVYLVADSPPVSTPELIRDIAQAFGRAPRLIPLPVALLRLGGRFLGRGQVIDRLAQSLVVDDRRARSVFGPVPVPDRRDAILRTCVWFQGNR